MRYVSVLQPIVDQNDSCDMYPYPGRVRRLHACTGRCGYHGLHLARAKNFTQTRASYGTFYRFHAEPFGVRTYVRSGLGGARTAS